MILVAIRERIPQLPVIPIQGDLKTVTVKAIQIVIPKTTRLDLNRITRLGVQETIHQETRVADMITEIGGATLQIVNKITLQETIEVSPRMAVVIHAIIIVTMTEENEKDLQVIDQEDEPLILDSFFQLY